MIQSKRKLNVWFYISYKDIFHYSATIYGNIVYLKLISDFWFPVACYVSLTMTTADLSMSNSYRICINYIALLYLE